METGKISDTFVDTLVSIHTGYAFFLFLLTVVYVIALFIYRLREKNKNKKKWEVVLFPIAFFLVFLSSAYVFKMPLLLVCLWLSGLSLFGLFTGRKKIRNTLLKDVSKAKHIFIGYGIAIFIAPFLYVIPTHLTESPLNSLYVNHLALAFFAAILLVTPLFYALDESVEMSKKEYASVLKKNLSVIFYWICLVTNIFVLVYGSWFFFVLFLFNFLGGPN